MKKHAETRKLIKFIEKLVLSTWVGTKWVPTYYCSKPFLGMLDPPTYPNFTLRQQAKHGPARWCLLAL